MASPGCHATHKQFLIHSFIFKHFFGFVFHPLCLQGKLHKQSQKEATSSNQLLGFRVKVIIFGKWVFPLPPPPSRVEAPLFSITRGARMQGCALSTHCAPVSPEAPNTHFATGKLTCPRPHDWPVVGRSEIEIDAV